MLDEPTPEVGSPDHRALLAALRRGSEGRLLEFHEREEALRAEAAEALAHRDAALGQRDLLAAHLRNLEVARAELVRDVLELAAVSRRRWRRRRGERDLLERIAHRLVALDLRPTGPELPFEGAGPSRAAAPAPVAAGRFNAVAALDVVILGHGSRGDLAVALRRLEERSSHLATVHVVQQAGGPDLQALHDALGQRADWTAVAAEDVGRDGGSVGLGAALRAGSAPFVALLDARCSLPWGWQHRLMATMRDPDIAAAVPLSTSEDAPAVVAVPAGAETLGLDALALLISRLPLPSSQPTEVLGLPCALVRRAALEAVGLPPSSGPAARQVERIGHRLVRRGWRVAVATDVLIDTTALRPQASTSSRQRAGAPGAALAAAEIAIADAVASPRSFGALLRRGGPLLRIAYVVPGSTSDSDPVLDAALTDVLGLRDLGLPVELLALSDRRTDVFPEGARPVPPGRLPDALRGFGVAVSASPTLAAVVAEAAAAHGMVAAALVHDPTNDELPDDVVALVTSEASRPRARGVAIEVPPAVDDDLFRPGDDDVETTRSLTVLVRGRPGGEPMTSVAHAIAGHLDADVAIYGAPILGSDDRVRELGPLARHDLAAALGHADVLLDIAPSAAGGRDPLAAMACGAVPIVAHGGAGAQLVHDGQDGVLVGGDDLDGWVDAVVGLAADWPLLQRLRTAALRTARHHGRMPGAAARYAAFEHLARTSELGHGPSAPGPTYTRPSS